MAVNTVIISDGTHTLDITGYILAEKGWTPGKNDIDGPNAGRAINADLIRDLIASKRTVEVGLRRLPESLLGPVLTILDSEFYTVSFRDVQFGNVTKTVMSNNYTWQRVSYTNGEEWYEMRFKMTEK